VRNPPGGGFLFTVRTNAMGVKSTISMTRQQAEERFTMLYLQHGDVQNLIRAKAASMAEAELGKDLERLNDIASGGEGFESYRILDE
jgi:hypothetical protein